MKCPIARATYNVMRKSYNGRRRNCNHWLLFPRRT
jgi:hypothetical protein